MIPEIRDFLVHLRLHYQFFILSGAFLCGGLFATEIDLAGFATGFLNVHVLLFGGATAYNSFHDKDEGPIGGLQDPPPLAGWTLPASLALQFVGLVLAMRVGVTYSAVYATSILFFWLYSTPHARWKGRPLLSLVAIGVSTGTNGFLLGYLASGQVTLPPGVLVASVGVAFIILSLYPVSQIYQVQQDTARGDTTFAIRFGLRGVRVFFATSYVVGITLLTASLAVLRPRYAPLLGAASAIAFVFIVTQLLRLKGEQIEYVRVMRLKYVTSLVFVFFIAGCLAFEHSGASSTW